MKEIQLDPETLAAKIEFWLPENATVELFLHCINRNCTMQLVNMPMQKGRQQLLIETHLFQMGIYVYVVKANKQQLSFGRMCINESIA